MNHKLLTLTLILLLALSSVNAELIINKHTDDFALASPNNEQIKMCSCETKVDRVVVENTGSFAADFHVQVDANYPGAIKVVSPDFVLAPKEFREVLIYIDDSCKAQGTFGYTITVRSSYGRVERLSRSINVDMCESTELTVTAQQDTVGLCMPARYEVTMRNIGKSDDAFVLNLGEAQQYASIPQTSVLLKPDQTYRETVTVTYPCAHYGIKHIPFTLTAQNLGAHVSTERALIIENQYDYTLNVETAMRVCADVTTQVPLQIDNGARVEDPLRIDVNGPRFVSLDGEHTTTLTLPANGTADIALRLAPTSAEVGTYPITLHTLDLYGGVEKSRTVDLTVDACYKPAVEFRSDAETRATESTLCCGATTYFVNVRNDGEREQVFNLALDAPSFFTLDETSVRLSPGQNANIPVRATLPCTDETNAAIVTVYPQGQPQLNATAQLVVNSQTQRTCHMVQIDADELVVRNDERVVPLLVRNTGIAGGNYRLDLESDLFSVVEQNITLEAGEERAVHLVPTSDLTRQAQGRYVMIPTLTLENWNIDYQEHVGVELKGKTFGARFSAWFWGLPWASVGICGWALLVLALVFITLVVILLLTYAGKLMLFSSGLRRDTLTLLKVLLAIGIVLLFIGLVFAPPPARTITHARNASDNATVLEWYQNEQRSVDLGAYFEDPDMDQLVFTATQSRDIRVHIEGTTMTLTPDHNFAGENTLVVTASDRRDHGMTDSPVFVLRVIPKQHLSFLGFVNAWCAQLLLSLLLLNLIVLLLFVLTIKEQRQFDVRKNIIVVTSSARKTTTKRVVKRSVKKVAPKKSVKKTTKSRATRAIAVRSARAVEIATPQRITRLGPSPGQTVNIAVGNPSPAMIAVPGAKQSEIVYIGSRDGDKVHTPYCMIARRIPRNKRVAYSSKREAMNAGLIPCKMCRPFEGGI